MSTTQGYIGSVVMLETRSGSVRVMSTARLNGPCITAAANDAWNSLPPTEPSSSCDRMIDGGPYKVTELGARRGFRYLIRQNQDNGTRKPCRICAGMGTKTISTRREARHGDSDHWRSDSSGNIGHAGDHRGCGRGSAPFLRSGGSRARRWRSR